MPPICAHRAPLQPWRDDRSPKRKALRAGGRVVRLPRRSLPINPRRGRACAEIHGGDNRAALHINPPWRDDLRVVRLPQRSRAIGAAAPWRGSAPRSPRVGMARRAVRTPAIASQPPPRFRKNRPINSMGMPN
jgi:hypothetical protein